MATVRLTYITTDGEGFIYQDSTLTGADAVDLQGALISNVQNPVSAQDAATKNYVDTAIANADDVQRVAQNAVPAGAAVYYSSNDQVSPGDSSTLLKCGAWGLAPAAIAPAAIGTIRRAGVVSSVLTGAIAGRPYFMGHTGLPVLAGALVPGDRIIRLGYAKNATDLEISIEDLGRR